MSSTYRLLRVLESCSLVVQGFSGQRCNLGLKLATWASAILQDTGLLRPPP